MLLFSNLLDNWKQKIQRIIRSPEE